MFLSKEKLLIAYYYIALIVFAVSACGVMFEQESENGISYINFIIEKDLGINSSLILRIYTYLSVKLLQDLAPCI